MVTEGLTDMDRERVIDEHALSVRDTDIVRVPDRAGEKVRLPEPLCDGLREMHAVALLLKEEAKDGADSMDSPAANGVPAG